MKDIFICVILPCWIPGSLLKYFLCQCFFGPYKACCTFFGRQKLQVFARHLGCKNRTFLCPNHPYSFWLVHFGPFSVHSGFHISYFGDSASCCSWKWLRGDFHLTCHVFSLEDEESPENCDLHSAPSFMLLVCIRMLLVLLVLRKWLYLLSPFLWQQ